MTIFMPSILGLCNRRAINAMIAILLWATVTCGAQAQSITTDPFIQDAIKRDNWEPGGKYYPGNFDDRGTITSRTGNVSIGKIYNQRAGTFSLQGASINGSYGYVNNLNAYHPWEVHSPFDEYTSNSDSDRIERPDGGQASVALNWTGTLVHPASAYDPPKEPSGFFPSPSGARDIYNFTINGVATGIYPLSQQDIQRFDPPPDFWRNVEARLQNAKITAQQHANQTITATVDAYQEDRYLDAAVALTDWLTGTVWALPAGAFEDVIQDAYREAGNGYVSGFRGLAPKAQYATLQTVNYANQIGEAASNTAIGKIVTIASNVIPGKNAAGKIGDAVDASTPNHHKGQTGGSPKPTPQFLPPTNKPQLPPKILPDGHSVRIMPPTTQYPNGYWVQTNQRGQPVNPATGKPPSNVTRPEGRSQTHVPLP